MIKGHSGRVNSLGKVLPLRQAEYPENQKKVHHGWRLVYVVARAVRWCQRPSDPGNGKSEMSLATKLRVASGGQR